MGVLGGLRPHPLIVSLLLDRGRCAVVSCSYYNPKRVSVSHNYYLLSIICYLLSLHPYVIVFIVLSYKAA